MEINQLKLKTSDQLRDDERAFLKENIDQLNDEDKEAYADFLGIEAAPAAEEEMVEPVGEEEAPPVESAPVTEAPPVVFKSEEEARAFVEKTVAEKNEREKQLAIDAAKTPEQKKYVDDNWKPESWNEGISVIGKSLKEELKAELKEDAKKEADAELANQKALRKQWDDVVEKNKLPTLETPEGMKVMNEVVELGKKYGQRTFSDAYELYSQMPMSAGGGLDVAAVKKAQGESRRQAAAKVSGNTAATDMKKPLVANYQALHGKSQSQLIRDARKALG